jgi:hypothetical protein
MNRILPSTNSTRSDLGTNSCHHGADVRSGTSATPLPWAKNLSSHGTNPLRGPNGGFIHTKPFHGCSRLPAVMQRAAGIHGATAAPGLATSRSNRIPIASKM